MVSSLTSEAPVENPEPQFKYHNILLDNGRLTMAGGHLSNWGHCKAAVRTLNHFFKGRDRSQIRIADLGCLEGGYSVEFARQGYRVLGIEAREGNIKKCRYVAANVNLPNLEFVQDDVRNISRYGTFDAVFCSGILYHLDAPVSFLRMLAAVTKQLLIVQSHYAADAPFFFRPSENKPSAREWAIRIAWTDFLKKIYTRPQKPGQYAGKGFYYLSGLSSHEGKNGRWHYEYPPEKTEDEINDMTLASYGNQLSFWLCKKDLLQAIKECGFDTIYEQYDFLGDIKKNPYIENHNRSFFVGVKSF